MTFWNAKRTGNMFALFINFMGLISYWSFGPCLWTGWFVSLGLGMRLLGAVIHICEED